MSAHPAYQASPADQVLGRLVVECFECAAMVVACAEADIAESDVRLLATAVARDLDWASLCREVGAFVPAGHGKEFRLICGAIAFCATACVICADGCDRHTAGNELCSTCSDARHRCARASAWLAGLFA